MICLLTRLDIHVYVFIREVKYMHSYTEDRLFYAAAYLFNVNIVIIQHGIENYSCCNF